MSRIPLSLINSLTEANGFDKESFEKVHESGEQITSVRFNPAKSIETSTSVIEKLDKQVAWSSAGYYLKERPSFTMDPLFHAGAYYVQEASSMFLEQAVKQTADVNKDLRVLDLCAAPGGKSTLLQSLISAGSLLVSNDVIKTRAHILEENLTKWGSANVIVTNNDPRDFARMEGFFDVIVIDAPCSGSGLFRRDPEAIDEWSEQNVQLCCQRQQRILADVWPALKNNGTLIYSTCSYSIEEDEDLLDWISSTFQTSSLPLLLNTDWNITEVVTPGSNHGYRFWPDKVKGEGFFIACMKKSEGEPESSFTFRKGKHETLTKAEEAIVRPWLNDQIAMRIFKQGDMIIAVPASLEKDMQAIINSGLYIRQAGVRVGKIAGKDFIPDHALALSQLVNPKLVAVSLKYEDAIQYLRREEVPMSEEIKAAGSGWALVKYDNANLGWIKILSNRVNNYYPKEWRILKK